MPGYPRPCQRFRRDFRADAGRIANGKSENWPRVVHVAPLWQGYALWHTRRPSRCHCGGLKSSSRPDDLRGWGGNGSGVDFGVVTEDDEDIGLAGSSKGSVGVRRFADDVWVDIEPAGYPLGRVLFAAKVDDLSLGRRNGRKLDRL